MKENRLLHEPAVNQEHSSADSNDTAADANTDINTETDTNTDTNVSGEDTENTGSDIAVDDSYFKEWLNSLYQGLLRDDYEAVLPLLNEFTKVWDKCAEYEYVGWSKNEGTEAAYKFTMEDGTVMGIVIYIEDEKEIYSISAFVSYTEDNGFGCIEAGDHLVQRNYESNMYTYIEGNIFYTVSPQYGNSLFDMSDGSVAVVWHV